MNRIGLFVTQVVTLLAMVLGMLGLLVTGANDDHAVKITIFAIIALFSFIVLAGTIIGTHTQEIPDLIVERNKLSKLCDAQEEELRNVSDSLGRMIEYLNGDLRHIRLNSGIRDIFFDFLNDRDTTKFVPAIETAYQAMTIIVPEHIKRTDLLKDAIKWLLLDMILLYENLAYAETLAIDGFDPDRKDRELTDNIRFMIRLRWERLFWLAEFGLFSPSDIHAHRDESRWTQVHDKSLRHYLKKRENYWAIRENNKLEAWHDYIEKLVLERDKVENNEPEGTTN